MEPDSSSLAHQVFLLINAYITVTCHEEANMPYQLSLEKGEGGYNPVPVGTDCWEVTSLSADCVSFT